MMSAIWWSPSKKGWVKLITDRVVLYINNCASVGGMFKDVDVRCLFEFLMAVGKETNFRVETRVMLEGLRITWKKRFKQLELECDIALLVETTSRWSCQ